MRDGGLELKVLFHECGMNLLSWRLEEVSGLSGGSSDFDRFDKRLKFEFCA